MEGKVHSSIHALWRCRGRHRGTRGVRSTNDYRRKLPSQLSRCCRPDRLVRGGSRACLCSSSRDESLVVSLLLWPVLCLWDQTWTRSSTAPASILLLFPTFNASASGPAPWPSFDRSPDAASSTRCFPRNVGLFLRKQARPSSWVSERSSRQ